MTILGFLTWAAGPFELATAGALPTTGTRLSLLAIELPRAITPTIAGLSVGAFVGVVGFIAVFLLVGRSDRRARRVAPRRVFIAPYGTMPRDTPLPPQAFVSSAHLPVAAPHAAPSHQPSSVAVAPHPLGIIKTGAAAMQPSTAAAMPGASIDDLAFDDSPTEIGETYFDEPPQPRRRSEPPKIRAIAPSAPRFREPTPPLPRVTPPPMRAVEASRG
jgi:hypothetical protein